VVDEVIEDLNQVAHPDYDRHAPRRDVSAVRLQGGYAAKRCPVRVVFDGGFAPAGTIKAADTVEVVARIADGIAFEREVFDEILASNAGTIEIDDTRPAEERVKATSEAMASGVEVILGAVLPDDEVGRRTGRPDVLVRAERRADGAWAYWPVDVKHHKAMAVSERDAAGDGVDARIALLLADETIAVMPLSSLPPRRDGGLLAMPGQRVSRDDLFQLAHYTRMIDACGHGSDSKLGAIIGKERAACWADLASQIVQQLWDRTRAANEGALDRYDFEFSFRLDALAAAAAGESLVEPVHTGECEQCPWREHCGPELEESDSPSLIPGVNYLQWFRLRRAGITTRADVAALPRKQAVPLASDANAWEIIRAADDAAPDTPISELLGGRHKRTKAMMAEEPLSLVRVGDLDRLDPRLRTLLRRKVSWLPEVIDQAWVATAGEGRPHRRRFAPASPLLHVDVEIDIDMENAIDGSVYLWGALRDDVYAAFVSWEPVDDRLEAEVFVDFWSWLRGEAFAAVTDGRSVAVYAWNDGAETSALRRGAAAAAEHLSMGDLPAQVESLVTGEAQPEGDPVHDALAKVRFIDLLVVYNAIFLHGSSSKLKNVAPLVGFRWRDDAPSGAASMVWHQMATAGSEVSEAGRLASRTRLLHYNEDDVRATAAIRQWMRSNTAPTLPD